MADFATEVLLFALNFVCRFFCVTFLYRRL
jgi:hypothetical protein